MGMTPTRVCALFLLLSASAVLVIFLAPYLAYTNHPYRSDQCYHFFSCAIKGQIGAFSCGSTHLLSVRDAPFYIRFFTGIVLYPLQFGKGIPSKVVIIFGTPVILDGAS